MDKGIPLVKSKRELPHVVLNLMIDGLSNEMLDDNLENMPNLKSLIEGNDTARVFIEPSFPYLTFPTHTNQLTGLWPSQHYIQGDQFQIDEVP